MRVRFPHKPPIYSSIAQPVERMTANHDVAGSSPAGGAIWRYRLNGLGHIPFKDAMPVRFWLASPYADVAQLAE